MARGLGKGIGALFPTETLESIQETIQNEEHVEKIPLQKLVANPFQPRKKFDDETIEELAQSIREHGIIQPIVVRKKGKKYEIVVGERRYRAAKLAKLEEIPAIIKEMTEEQMMELAILENLQREDLTPIEEAEAYQNLIEKLNFTQDDLAKRLGKSRPHITNMIRLLQLPEEVRQMVNDGALSMGHGRALLGLKNKRKIIEVAKKVVNQSLNVRQLEALIKQLNENVSRETKNSTNKDIFVQATESQLREFFGTNVQIKKTKNKGKIEIEFYSEDDLERILEILNLEHDEV
ncbi:ParB/RepB/Spo0J family partition protein [Ureibacillus thermosphaericus]|uniref:ParB/RepB/Spo0J family partition protein n=1 Tax=Ureibacillus thermosphaericus TaxID=51173 RepID=UPI000BBC5FDA|nr:ParB/RepB/Spo0J family partition protein [Ureibacillus thermosphaericus]